VPLRRSLRRPLAVLLVAAVLAALLAAGRPQGGSPPLFAAGLLGNGRALHPIGPHEAQGAAFLAGSDVLRLRDGRLRYLPPGAAAPVTVPAGDPGALTAAARDRAWLAGGTVPGAAAAERDAAARALLDLRLLLRPAGAALAAQTPAWAHVWPRDASFAAAAFALTGHRPEAAAIVGFLAGTQRADGTWPARSEPDGRPVDDGRPAQLDATGWVPWAAWLASDRGRDRAVAARLWPAVRAAATAAAGSLGADGLPRAGPDYWERHERAPTLGTAAALLAGLRAAARLGDALGEPDGARLRRAAARLDRAVRRRFAPTGYQRYPGGGGPDAAVAWLAPPFAPPDAGVLAALTRAARRLTVAGAGAVPGLPWRLGDPWTPATATLALAELAAGDRAAGSRRLGWLLDHRTTLGALPERVRRRDGAPRSVAPLGWTCAIVLLALVSEERPIPVP
jgi:glucoamylase